jgi:peptide/nickel transport system permease protein
MMVSAINNRDYTSLRASVLVVALAISVINLVVDLSFCLIDPRVKAQYTVGKKKKKKEEKAA